MNMPKPPKSNETKFGVEKDVMMNQLYS